MASGDRRIPRREFMEETYRDTSVSNSPGGRLGLWHGIATMCPRGPTAWRLYVDEHQMACLHRLVLLQGRQRHAEPALSSGSATVSVPSTTGIGVGYQVTGTGIPSGTTVTAIGSSGSQVTLSQNATVSGGENLTFTPIIAPPQVVALIEPAGGVVTPASSSPLGPLTILSGSQGFNTRWVYDYLANTPAQNGQPLQALGLSFYGQGLASLANGGILKFSLDVANPSSPPQLVSQTPGVTISSPIFGYLNWFDQRYRHKYQHR